MSTEVSSTILGTEDLYNRLGRMTPAIRDHLVLGMNNATIRLQSYIVENKLSGDPLHRRSGHLSAATQQDVQADEDAVIGRVSNNMDYAAVHENGGTFMVPEHIVRWSKATMRARGYDVKNMKAGMSVEGMVRAHTATYPQRAFMRPSYDDLKDWITDTLRQATEDGIQAGASGG